jgi:hypothetical protein
MIEAALLNYGVLGLWTLTLLTQTYKYRQEMKKIIENNTVAMTKVYEVIKHCPQTI